MLRRLVLESLGMPSDHGTSDEDLVERLLLRLQSKLLMLYRVVRSIMAGEVSGPSESLETDEDTEISPLLVCPTDFRLDAACRIIMAGGGKVRMTASDLPGFSGGTFAWSTTSTKIRLTNSSTATVTVESLTDVSASRDAEQVTVTRTSSGCSTLSKTVGVTVAKVEFSASPSQRYGYDDFDTPTDHLDDHVSIKKSDHTFVKVDITGGAVATDFDFACDDTSVCTVVAPGSAASFDLRLDAGAKNKDGTMLQAKVKCPGATSFAKLAVHVYKETVVDVVVAKIHDSAVAATALRFPTADYGAHTGTVNAKLKEAIVKYNITNYDPGNAVTDVRYDLDGNGVLTYDIAGGGGAELAAIRAAMTGTGTRVRVAIVREMKSFYYLSAAAAHGASTITVAAAGTVFFSAGRAVSLGTGASLESVTIVSAAGNVLTLAAPLTNDHAIGEPLEFMAAGWSSDPIVIVEGTTSLSTVEWTIPHEVGHRALQLADVNDATNFMNFEQSWTDYRLRYCPRTKTYSTGTENQWEKIPR